jgi:hypothetical protein
MENLQNAIQEGALALMLNDAINSINRKIEIDKKEKPCDNRANQIINS